MTLLLGRHPGFPEAAYHADPGIGSSTLKALAESPAAARAAAAFPPEKNDAMDLGSAFHMALLQPERFARSVFFKPDGLSLATKEGKAWRAEIAAQTLALGVPDAEVVILSADQGFRLDAMMANRARVEGQLGLDPFAEPGESECAYFWGDAHEAPGGQWRALRGKALVDRELRDLPWLLDVKTTRVAVDDRNLLRHMGEYGWPLQAAWYRRGVAKVRDLAPEELMFVFVVFQTVPPFSVRVCPVPAETLILADRLVDRALANLAELNDTAGLPRDPLSTMLELRYPEWMKENLALT